MTHKGSFHRTSTHCMSESVSELLEYSRYFALSRLANSVLYSSTVLRLCSVCTYESRITMQLFKLALKQLVAVVLAKLNDQRLVAQGVIRATL